MDIKLKNALERLGHGILVGAVQLRREESIQIVRYIDDLQKRLEALRVSLEGNTNIPEKMAFLKDEQNSRTIQGTEYIEFSRHYVLPMANIPGLAREAYASLVDYGLGDNIKRIYYAVSQGGYIAVLIDEMIRKDGKIEAGEMQLLDDIIKNLPEI